MGDEEGQVWMPFLGEKDPPPNQVAPYVTTSHTAIQAAFDLLPFPLTQHNVLLDLGCGDGRIVNMAASKYGCRGFGVDLDVELLVTARKFAADLHLDHLVEFVQQDFISESFDFSLPWASGDKWNGPTVIAFYQTPKALRLLEPKLINYAQKAKSQANIHVQIVSFVWGFKNWQTVAEDPSLKIFIYDFLDTQKRMQNKTNNKADDGFLPAFC